MRELVRRILSLSFSSARTFQQENKRESKRENENEHNPPPPVLWPQKAVRRCAKL
jgi:hypothetical protein